jgi:hypothetical protein
MNNSLKQLLKHLLKSKEGWKTDNNGVLMFFLAKENLLCGMIANKDACFHFNYLRMYTLGT